MTQTTIDIDALNLRSGQAKTRELELRPDPPVVGGVTFDFVGDLVPGRFDISKTTSGWALRLRAEATITGPCSRCVDDADVPLTVDLREVSQPGTDDAELNSPYVGDGLLDALGWLHDGLVLAVPKKILCRPGCKGICDICGVSLNEVDAATHSHDKPLDPRFAKLRELGGS